MSKSSGGELVPYLCVDGAEKALRFYREVFAVEEVERFQEEPGGRIGHLTLRVFGATLFMADEHPEIGVLSPASIGGSPVTLHLTVPDVDSVFQKALELGAVPRREPANQGYGHRNAKFTDPFGHEWMTSTPS